MENSGIVDICGVRINNVSMHEAVQKVSFFIERKKPVFLTTPNADHIVKLQKDPEFHNIYEKAELVLADGMPLIWASKFLGTPLKEKVSGSDLFPELCRLSADRGFKVFFFGGREGAAGKTSNAMKAKYPGLDVVGFYSPPFGFEADEKENIKIYNMIKNSGPDILFVGLGAPRQEKWIFSYYRQLSVPVSVGVGITFEFVSGMVKRAPKWMQKSGLEWFWRILQEPGRLWKRYIIEDMKFFWLVLRQRFK